MAKVPTPPQFVLLAFDGSSEVEFWKATRQFAASAEVRFTYFISGVVSVSSAHRPTRDGRGGTKLAMGGSATRRTEEESPITIHTSETARLATPWLLRWISRTIRTAAATPVCWRKS